MKKKFFLIIFCLLSFHCFGKIGPSAITWKPNGGRFGDDLLSYSKAKWIEYKFGLPILCQYFNYVDELILYENEEMFTIDHLKQFSKVMHLFRFSPHILSKTSNTLYISRWKTDITIDWSDQTFLSEIKKNIAPRHDLEKITIPEGVVSIAAHVRNGGTFAADTPEEKERCPLRFVPEEFFIEQIQRIAEMYPSSMLYVHIFTDHPNPKKLVKKFALAVNNTRVIFGCRETGNSHKSNVLEDFFSMMDFDCLIRPGSHFTRFVQRLGNNKLVIYPESIKEIHGKKVIDTIKIKTRDNVSKPWKTKTVVIA